MVGLSYAFDGNFDADEEDGVPDYIDKCDNTCKGYLEIDEFCSAERF